MPWGAGGIRAQHVLDNKIFYENKNLNMELNFFLWEKQQRLLT